MTDYAFSIVWANRADWLKDPESAVSQGEMHVRSTSPEFAEIEFHQNHPDKVAWAVWHGTEWANRHREPQCECGVDRNTMNAPDDCRCP